MNVLHTFHIYMYMWASYSESLNVCMFDLLKELITWVRGTYLSLCVSVWVRTVNLGAAFCTCCLSNTNSPACCPYIRFSCNT